MTRVVLVVLCVALVALALFAMRAGWRNRATRQAELGALPQPPADLNPPIRSITGLYVGSTYAGRWQDRIVHGGLGIRAAGEAVLHDTGVLIERDGAPAIFLPRDGITEARLAAGLAGKVSGPGGLLVITWQLGDAAIDTGFRADDKTDYPAWVRALNEKATV
jgi:hypothetical protein